MTLRRLYLPLFLAGCMLFLPFLGRVNLFDWDEINFAECAREMIESGDYLRAQINFQPFYEKPPLFIWLQVLSMKAFGVNAYAARLPNALIGIATLLILYHIGRRRAGEQTGRWWAILYACTWLPHFYFKSAIIDPLFNLLIFAGVVQLFAISRGEERNKRALFAGLLIGLAVLTKGPVAILVSGLCFGVYFVWKRGRTGIPWTALVIMAAACTVVIAAWVVPEVLLHGWDFPREFLLYQIGLFSQNIADHAEPWYYHPIVLLIGCFPVSVFLFQWRRKRSAHAENDHGLHGWMWILFWVVLILFSIVKTKIVHYSSLCYFPMTYLAAREIVRIRHGERVKRGVQIAFVVIGCLLGLLITLLPLAGSRPDWLKSQVADPNVRVALDLPVRWHPAEAAWGALFVVAVVVTGWLLRKRGRAVLLPFFLAQVVLIEVTVILFTPRIEAYSQRSAIDFFKSKQGRNAYLHTLGYKSYAHLFYGGVTAASAVRQDESELLTGPLDREAFFAAKSANAREFEERYPLLRKLYDRGGFVFYTRAEAVPSRN